MGGRSEAARNRAGGVQLTSPTATDRHGFAQRDYPGPVSSLQVVACQWGHCASPGQQRTGEASMAAALPTAWPSTKRWAVLASSSMRLGSSPTTRVPDGANCHAGFAEWVMGSEGESNNSPAAGS